MSTLSVAVIGAGAAGLCAARHLLAAKLRVSLFEQADCVGGTWVYTDTTSQEAAGPIHSSMYRNLHTNLPKEVMAFLDFPFPASSESFVHHSVVRSYLELYCQHFGLSSCLQLGTAVQRVRPAEGGRWVQTDQSRVSSDWRRFHQIRCTLHSTVHTGGVCCVCANVQVGSCGQGNTAWL